MNPLTPSQRATLRAVIVTGAADWGHGNTIKSLADRFPGLLVMSLEGRAGARVLRSAPGVNLRAELAGLGVHL